jgi:hypothetical protein
MQPDKSIEILIKTILDAQGGELTIRQQREIQKAIKQTGDTSELTVRQMREMERAAQKAGGETLAFWQKIQPQSTAGARGSNFTSMAQYGAPIGPQVTPPPVIPPSGSHGLNLNSTAMRRHFGAVAGQVLGMPGMGMMMAGGGMVAGIGAAVLALERMVTLFGELGDTARQIEDIGRSYTSLGDQVKSVESYQRSLNRETEIFQLQLFQIQREVFNTANMVQQLNDLREHEAGLQIRLHDQEMAKRREAMMLATVGNPFGRIQGAGELDKEAARIAIENEIKAEERKQQLIADRKRMAEDEKKKSSEEKQTAEAALATQRKTTQEVTLTQGNAAKSAQTLYEQYDKLRVALEKIQEGRFDAFPAFMKASGALGLAGEDVTGDISLLQQTSQFGMYAGRAMAGGRLATVRQRMQTLSGQVLSSGENIEAQTAQQKLIEDALAAAKGRISKSTEQIEEANRDLPAQEERLRILREVLEKVMREQFQGIDTRTLRETIEQSPVNIPASAGGASTQGVEMRLDRLIAIMEAA